ncbi:hypothetical protein D9757_000020 [Collybiopsis confluens]|uniref:Cytoplasmic protein n=1 Tax=Collybiopsis confluens TaxID=2823264 RepID=A0A8H5MH01_9AGAR|nr:hypothetical protein D9757_000020 [Collybiopsis confluens]
MSSSRALNAILPQIASSPYEAHQKARTFASRYVKSNQYDVAIDVLFQSSRELLKTGQPGSGVDLAGFLLEVYDSKGKWSVTRVELIALTGSSGSWRKTLIDKSLAWSAKHGVCPAGDQTLHHYVGELLYKEGSFEAAEPHFLASGSRDSARLLAEEFIQWASPSGTFGPFALRGILPYLQNGNVLAAKTFIKHFVSSPVIPRSSVSSPTVPVGSSSEDEIIVTQDSIINFAQLAVVTCQRAQGERNKVMRESWVRLCGTYQSKGGVLAEPEVRKALYEIATLYFAIPPPRNQAANPFGDMLSTLFGAPGGTGGSGSGRRLLTPAAASTGLD